VVAPSITQSAGDDGLPSAFRDSLIQVREKGGEMVDVPPEPRPAAEPDTASAPIKAKKRKQAGSHTATQPKKAAGGGKDAKRKAAQDEIDDIFGGDSD
jgi:hypothetical protein